MVALFIPAVRSRDAEVAAALGAATKDCGKTVVSCFLGMPGVPSALRIGDGERGSVPSYPTPEDAVRALAALTDYATWRAAPAGHTVVPANLDVRGAREVVARLLGRAETVQLDARDTSTLLACYGIDVWETVPAADAEAAVAAAGRLGYPVALKALAPHLRHRRELGGVRLDIADDDELRADFAGLVARLGDVGPLGVQRMAPTGVACRLAAVEDPLFGPVVSFGIGGAATDLLDDRAYAVPPLTDTELQRLVTSVRAAPLLLGGDGAPAADLAALRDLLARVGRLADDLPEVATVELNPVVAAPDGATVLSAAVGLARPTGRAERGARALPG